MKSKLLSLIEEFDNIRGMDLIEALTNREKIVDFRNQLGDYCEEATLKAKEEILKSMPEENFVKTIGSIFSLVVSGLAQEGKMSPLKFFLSDESEMVMHSVVLAVIGALMDEEVL